MESIRPLPPFRHELLLESPIGSIQTNSQCQKIYVSLLRTMCYCGGQCCQKMGQEFHKLAPSSSHEKVWSVR
jgi:hypothetical protein